MGDHRVRLLEPGPHAALSVELARLDIDEPWAQYMAHKGAVIVLRIERVRGKAASLLKQHMLSLGGDCAVGRQVANFDDTPAPVVLLGTRLHYQQMIHKLAAQPFELAAIAQEIAVALERLAGPPEPIRCGEHLLRFDAGTLVMGIINTTPDSFSGDGLSGDVEAALAQARRFVAEGADILDVGGQSTRPGSDDVELEEEIRRTAPVIAAICSELDVPVSVDTSRPQVAEAAIAAGASFINDIYALRRDGMLQVAADSGAGVCLMHMQGTPGDMQQSPTYGDLMAEVYESLATWLEAAVAGGVCETQIMIDPGFGFGKTVNHNIELVRRLRELTSLGRPILMGASRKSSIGTVLGLPDASQRLWGTAAVNTLAVANGAAMVRVHDVAEMAQVAAMADAVLRGWGE
jgi:dihydropteroate synthase